jgi:hypothetical protein
VPLFEFGEQRATGRANRVLPESDDIIPSWGVVSGETKREMKYLSSIVNTVLAIAAIENGLYFVTRNTQDAIRSGATLFNPRQDDPFAFPIL